MALGEMVFWSIFILASASAIGYMIYCYRKGSNILKETALSLGAKCDSMGRYVINKNGVRYWYQYSPGSRNSPPVLKVSVPCLSHGEFTVVHESEFDKMAKKVGFSSELQTQDADFDNNYYILSDTVDFARIYFQSSEKRDIIKNIYRTGFNHIKHNGRSVEASWPGFSKSNLNGTLITETITDLVKLSQNVPDYFRDQEFFGIPRLRIKAVALHLFPYLVLAAAAAAWFWVIDYPPLDGFDVFLRSLLFSIPAIILYLIIAGLAIRKRAAAHKDFLSIALISVIAFLLFGNNAFILANGAKDAKEPMSHTVPVVGKYLTHHKNSTTRHVVVQSWRSGHDTEEFRVEGDTYSRIRENRSRAAIVTKPGALGFEWVVSKQFSS